MFSSPPEYDPRTEAIIDSVDGAKRPVVTTRRRGGFRDNCRHAPVSRDGQWRIDGKQRREPDGRWRTMAV